MEGFSTSLFLTPLYFEQNLFFTATVATIYPIIKTLKRCVPFAFAAVKQSAQNHSSGSKITRVVTN